MLHTIAYSLRQPPIPATACCTATARGPSQRHAHGIRRGRRHRPDQAQWRLAAYSTTDGGVKSIDPNKLTRDPFKSCKPVYPWNFIRANTIFGVIHQAGGYTAWSDKHAVYAAVSGPTGTSTPSNVDDFYSPEVNSNSIALPGVKTATGLDCSKLPNNNGGDWTTDFDNIKCYDQLKVNAVLNWIHGKSHLGTSTAPVPTIFGMNFQAVSVGEKLIEKGVFGGYTGRRGNTDTQHARRNSSSSMAPSASSSAR